MPLDDLWSLHERITKVLSTRILAQKQQLEQRLLQLNLGGSEGATVVDLKRSDSSRLRARRKYPMVHPKFQNPSEPEETWSGRGKQPRWLVAALRAGRKIEDFAILADRQEKTARTRR